MNYGIFSLVIPIVAFLASDCVSEDKNKPIRVAMVVSDQTVLVNDAVNFKLRIVNRLGSTVIVTGEDNTKFKVLLEYREGKDEWQKLGDVRAWRPESPATNSYISLEPKETYAIYGFVLSKSNPKDRVFDHVGTYDIRLRMHCMLGEFVTDTVVIVVRERPKAEMDVLAANNGSAASRFQAFFHLFNLEGELPKEFEELRSELHSGSIDGSLELAGKIGKYLESSTVDGKTCTFHQAFGKLSEGLDEVRTDVAAIYLCYFATKRNKLDDAATIVAHLKDNGLMRNSLLFEFNNKLRPVPRVPMP
ncbi:MAG: hypothetical protein IAF94_17440 [Pirellulaceae bacterium]|nr:hypothetical protein [Pirellulaceae bacterium]